MEEGPAFKRLTPLEQRQRMTGLQGWTVNEGRLEKEYRFKDFVQVLVFLNKAINPIEENMSYPRITIAYNRLKLSLMTTAAGAITSLDFEMAMELDRLAGGSAEQTEQRGIKA